MCIRDSSKTVVNLLASIKLQAYSPPLPIETDRIHVANGTYFMDGSFTADPRTLRNDIEQLVEFGVDIVKDRRVQNLSLIHICVAPPT